jgi:hypothetical protein
MEPRGKLRGGSRHCSSNLHDKKSVKNRKKLNQCCYITVDPETSASENGVPDNDLVSQRLCDKKMKVFKM